MYQLTGTKGMANKYPNQGLALGGENLEGLDSENLEAEKYMTDAQRDSVMIAYQHPITKDDGLAERARKVGGHGGMDFSMDYRLVYCLHHGLPLDQDVYDAAEWSSLVELTEVSIKHGSMPVVMPDFTRGEWDKTPGLTLKMAESSSVFGEIRPDRKDDLIWENEFSGYRAFGPALQAKGEKSYGYDIFTKSVSHLVMHDRFDKDLGPDHISFHIDHGDGMDSYGVGATLGCGTAALIDSTGIVYPWCWKEAEILENGPKRFQVRLTYSPILVNGREVVEHRLITLESGQRMNRVDLSYDGLDSPCPIVVGIVVHAENPKGYYTDGKVLAVADLGDRNIGQNGEIYCGALLPEGFESSGFEAFDEPKGSAIGHVLGHSTYTPGSTFTYYFGSGWSKAGIANLEEWIKLISQ